MGRLIYTAGQLDQRVTFMARTPGQDALGQPSGEWKELVCTVWARQETVGATEGAAAGSERLTVRQRFVIRARGDVVAKLRAVWRGQIFEVESALPAGDQLEWLDVLCKVAK